MATNRSIALNYLGRLRHEVEDCLYCIDKDEEHELYEGIFKVANNIEVIIKIINELEME